MVKIKCKEFAVGPADVNKEEVVVDIDFCPFIFMNETDFSCCSLNNTVCSYSFDSKIPKDCYLRNNHIIKIYYIE